jgi:hypothetical protein
MKLPSIMSPDGRRAWSFAAIVGACMVFTVFAAVGVYLVRNSVSHAFWLAIAAHAQILVGLTAIGWTLGRRVVLSGGKSGVTISDSEVAVVLPPKPAEPKEPEE